VLSCLGAHVAAPAIARGLAPDGAVYAERVTPPGARFAATSAGVCPFRPLSGV